MKRFFGIILFPAYFCCHAQDGVVFKVLFKPEMTYGQTVEETTETTIRYSGSKEVLQNLKANGVENPTIGKDSKQVQSLFKTGKLSSNDIFPISINFVKTAGSEGSKPIPEGTVIYGQCSAGNKLTFDSISGSGFSDDYKRNLLQASQSVMSQVPFPDKMLKVGESFNQQSSLQLPLGDIPIDVGVTTTYKLLSIVGTTAAFDVSQVFSLNTTIEGYDTKLTGQGKGELHHDTRMNFHRRLRMDIEMQMTMKIQDIGIDMLLKSSTIQTYRY